MVLKSQMKDKLVVNITVGLANFEDGVKLKEQEK
jgi:hypothetical protein